MMERLFGSTLEEQLKFLRYRILISVIVSFVGCVTMFSSSAGSVIIVLVAYVWAWTFLKRWFGITTIGAIFSGNVVIAVLLFVAYLVIGYLIGLVTFIMGVIRYIQIKIIMHKEAQ